MLIKISHGLTVAGPCESVNPNSSMTRNLLTCPPYPLAL